MGLKSIIVDKVLPMPVSARHAEYSMIISSDDDPGRPDEFLIDVGLNAAKLASTIRLPQIAARAGEAEKFINCWPGEHYRLLAGFVKYLQPKLVLEIGTATGASALALLEELPANGKLVTFDIVPWREYPGSVFRESDFSDGRLAQSTDDLTRSEGFKKNEALLLNADVIFVDAAKDGEMEARLLELFAKARFKNSPLVIFDDIRVWNMLNAWRQISLPKLDLTSFGHWSGTGLVHWVK